MSTRILKLFSTALAILALGVTAMPAASQATGSITGLVTDAASLRPIAMAQLFIPGTGRGTLTNSAGRYLLLGVPVGTVTLRVELIGYATVEREVTVVATGTQIDVSMSGTAIALDEIVVTGTGRATEMRRLGNVVGRIAAIDLVNKAPIRTVDELLQGRVAGVRMNLSGGSIGTGGTIRIRGTSSVALNSNPVVYVDGVRIDAAHNTDLGVGGQDLSRFQDLRPGDIERIEIVKGAAAATLFGTQGSNGVIQIFTKRGRQGPAQWSAEISQGFNRIPGDFPGDTFPGRLFEQFQGPDGFWAHDPKEIIGNGHYENYGLSVSGGTQTVNYYVSGGFKKESGSIFPETNWNQVASFRANVNAILSPTLNFSISSSFTSSRTRIPDNDNGLHGIYSQAVSAIPYTADSDRVFGERWGSVNWNATLENRQNTFRQTVGVAFDHRPNATFGQRVSVGLDWYRQESMEWFPFAYKGSGNKLGNKQNRQRNFKDVTVDYRATITQMLPGGIESDLAVGAQGNFTNTVRVTARGRDFPGPGVKTVSGAATTTGQETRVEEMNAGLYVQETLGFSGKLFLTGGLRADGNSAFGNEFDYQLYPKVALAYSLSEESWWPSKSIPTMKLRFAYGTSGLAPSQFAADRTWSPIAAENGQPAVTPGNLGDPDLGPEKSSEFEIGFDAGLFGNRLGLEVTAYFQTTTDALLEKQAAPSLGFQSPQLTNIGEVKNRGVEVSLLALLMRSENFEWNSSINFSTQHNEVTDLGGLTPFGAGGDTRITEGYPVQGKWGRRIESWDPVLRKHTQTSERFYVGSTDPSWFGAVATDVRYGSFSLRVSGDFAGGHIQQNFSRWWSIRVKTGDDYLSLVSKPDGTPTLASDSILDYALTGGGVDPMFISDADWFVLREISLGYEIPDGLLGGVGMRGSTLTLSARNLKEWSVYDGISPQTNWNGGGNFIGGGEDFNTMAPLRSFILTFRTAF